MAQYFTLHLNNMEITWHTVHDDEQWQMTDVGMRILKTTQKIEKKNLMKLNQVKYFLTTLEWQIAAVHNTSVYIMSCSQIGTSTWNIGDTVLYIYKTIGFDL